MNTAPDLAQVAAIVRRHLPHAGLECGSPRQALRAAVKLGWIADDPAWLDMLDDRNRTSHTYNEKTAEEIFSRLSDDQARLAALLEALRHAVSSQ